MIKLKVISNHTWGKEIDSAVEDTILSFEEDGLYSKIKKAVKEQVRIYFHDNLKIEKPNIGYDCTGLPFTTSWKIIDVDIDYRTVTIRHFIGYDI